MVTGESEKIHAECDLRPMPTTLHNTTTRPQKCNHKSSRAGILAKWVGLLMVAILARRPAAGERLEPPARQQYLRTPAGEIRGMAIETDLAAAPGAWRLWAAGIPGQPLRPIDAQLEAAHAADPPVRFAVMAASGTSSAKPSACGGRGRRLGRAFAPQWLGHRRGPGLDRGLEATVSWRRWGAMTRGGTCFSTPRPVPRRTPFVIRAGDLALDARPTGAGRGGVAARQRWPSAGFRHAVAGFDDRTGRSSRGRGAAGNARRRRHDRRWPGATDGEALPTTATLSFELTAHTSAAGIVSGRATRCGWRPAPGRCC
jgi:hypothetical protein